MGTHLHPFSAIALLNLLFPLVFHVFDHFDGRLAPLAFLILDGLHKTKPGATTTKSASTLPPYSWGEGKKGLS